MMEAEEASLKGGLFEHILKFYERWMRRALEHPVLVGRAVHNSDRCLLCLLHFRWAATCFRPWMREGSSSITSCRPAVRSRKTTRVLNHVEQIVRSVSRGRKHLTAHRFAVGAGSRHGAKHWGYLGEAQGQTKVATLTRLSATFALRWSRGEPALDVEFVQVLQDMIADLTGAPQPVVGQTLLSRSGHARDMGPLKSQMRWGGFQVKYTKPVVDIEGRNREHDKRTCCGCFNINTQTAAKAGFHKPTS